MKTRRFSTSVVYGFASLVLFAGVTARAQVMTSFPENMTPEQAKEFLDKNINGNYGYGNTDPILECSSASEQRPNVILKDRTDDEMFAMIAEIGSLSSHKNNANYARASTPKLTECGLHDAEIAAIRNYTASGYSVVNQVLRNNIPKEVARYAGYVRVLESGLEKFKPYRGLVRRGAELPTQSRAEFIFSDAVVFRGFTSTSVGSGFGRTDRMLILSRTCRWVDPFSSAKGEREVLCPTNMVVKIRYQDEQGYNKRYLLEEADESDGMMIDPVW